MDLTQSLEFHEHIRGPDPFVVFLLFTMQAKKVSVFPKYLSVIRSVKFATGRGGFRTAHLNEWRFKPPCLGGRFGNRPSLFLMPPGPLQQRFPPRPIFCVPIDRFCQTFFEIV